MPTRLSAVLRGLTMIPLAVLLASTAAAQTPTADDMKRAVEERLQKIWKGLGTPGTRTVLFQAVQAGRPSPGSFPFKLTLAIHDQEVGYPPNKYYGRTCVGHLQDEIYVLKMDDFGEWSAEGRMTPSMSDQTCKNNPSAGVSAIPVSTLEGTKAPPLGSAPAKAAPALTGPPQGAYECWANGQARMLLNFTVLPNNQYRDAEGQAGKFEVNAANGRMTFHGGNLDGVLPAGFYALFHAPQGHATVSFRNSGGAEVSFCEHK